MNMIKPIANSMPPLGGHDCVRILRAGAKDVRTRLAFSPTVLIQRSWWVINRMRERVRAHCEQQNENVVRTMRERNRTPEVINNHLTLEKYNSTIQGGLK